MAVYLRVKNLYIIRYRGFAGLSRLYVKGFDNAVAMLKDTRKDDPLAELYYAERGKYGIVSEGELIQILDK